MNLTKSKDSKNIYKNLVDIAIDGIDDDNLSQACVVVKNALLRAEKIGSKAIAGKAEDDKTAFARIEEVLKEQLDLDSLNDAQKIKLQDFIVFVFDAKRISSAESVYRKNEVAGYVEKALKEVPLPGRDDITEDESFDLLVDHLGQIRVSNVFTMHPTFSGTLEYSNLMHEYAEAVSAKDTDKAKELGARLMSPDFRTTLVDSLTPEQEGEYGREFVNRSCKAIPTVYAEFDKALAKRSDSYDPINLNLDIITESWILTDKDGNPNVTHEATQYAINAKREDAAELFTGILENFHDSADGNILSARLQKLTKMPYEEIASLREDMTTFFKDSYYAAKESNDTELTQVSLDAHRKLEHYGLSMGQQEYRETADVFAPIIDLVTGLEYTGLEDSKKDLWLTEAFDDLERLAGFKAKMEAYSQLEGEGEDRIVKDTYNRIKLALENPDIFAGQHALAEAETPLQMKEYLLFLKSMGAEEQIRITPLFEKPEILTKMGDVVNTMLTDPTLKSYYINLSLAEFKREGIDFDLDAKFEEGSDVTIEDKIRDYEYGDKKDLDALNKAISDNSNGRYLLSDILKVEIMFAHSDNGRRGGTVGARGALSEAHRAAYEAAEDLGFGVRFYEGGSRTDPMRGGVRSIKSQINKYDQRDGNGHTFIKSTVQGRDLNELLINAKTYALYLAEELVTGIKGTSFWNGEEFKKPEGRESVNFNQAASPVTEIVHAAVGSLDHYSSSFFNSETANSYVMDVLGYLGVASATNKGSRPKVREDDDGKVKEPSIQDTRTIPFSQTCLFGRSNISFIGYKEFINKAYADISVEVQDICDKANPVMDKEANHDIAKHLEFAQFAKLKQTSESSYSSDMNSQVADFEYDGVKPKEQVTALLYQKSPTTKDITDRVAYAIATSDMNYVENLAAEICETKVEMRDFITKIKGEYVAAAEHVLEAYTGKPQDLKEKSYDKIREAVKDQMIDKDLIDMGDVALSFVNVVNESMDEQDNVAKYNATAKATLHRPKLATEASLDKTLGMGA